MFAPDSMGSAGHTRALLRNLQQVIVIAIKIRTK